MDTITYAFQGGRVGLHTNVPPFTVPMDGTHEDQLIEYLTLLMTTPGAQVTLDGHPDALWRAAKVGAPGAKEYEKDGVTTFSSYVNDPSCGGRYTAPQEDS